MIQPKPCTCQLTQPEGYRGSQCYYCGGVLLVEDNCLPTLVLADRACETVPPAPDSSPASGPPSAEWDSEGAY